MSLTSPPPSPPVSPAINKKGMEMMKAPMSELCSRSGEVTSFMMARALMITWNRSLIIRVSMSMKVIMMRVQVRIRLSNK